MNSLLIEEKEKNLQSFTNFPLKQFTMRRMYTMSNSARMLINIDSSKIDPSKICLRSYMRAKFVRRPFGGCGLKLAGRWLKLIDNWRKLAVN